MPVSLQVTSSSEDAKDFIQIAIGIQYVRYRGWEIVMLTGTRSAIFYAFLFGGALPIPPCAARNTASYWLLSMTMVIRRSRTEALNIRSTCCLRI